MASKEGKRPKKQGQVTKQNLLEKYSHFLNNLSLKMHAQAGQQTAASEQTLPGQPLSPLALWVPWSESNPYPGQKWQPFPSSLPSVWLNHGLKGKPWTWLFFFSPFNLRSHLFKAHLAQYTTDGRFREDTSQCKDRIKPFWSSFLSLSWCDRYQPHIGQTLVWAPWSHSCSFWRFAGRRHHFLDIIYDLYWVPKVFFLLPCV